MVGAKIPSGEERKKTEWSQPWALVVAAVLEMFFVGAILSFLAIEQCIRLTFSRSEILESEEKLLNYPRLESTLI